MTVTTDALATLELSGSMRPMIGDVRISESLLGTRADFEVDGEGVDRVHIGDPVEIRVETTPGESRAWSLWVKEVMVEQRSGHPFVGIVAADHFRNG